MPGKPSTRTSTASRVSRKSSVPVLNSRPSQSRLAAQNVVIPDEGPTTALRINVCSVFDDAQKSTAGHRKLIVNLRKIQEACCYESTKPSKNSLDGFEEADFNAEVARCVIRLVIVKKSEGVGDRMVRFLGLFLRHASDKDAALLPEGEADETQSFPETPSSRLTSHILSTLLPLLVAKEKTVRYRSTQIISQIINSLDSIDDEYYNLLRMGLLKRIRDKEPMVRVQAVLGLGRLAGNEGDGEQDNDDSDDDDDASGLLEKLLEVLQNDPSTDVRRSLLLNLPLTPATLPYLLERARDLDPATRRALYSRLLPALGDFRHLSLSMREKLLRWGLRDRDEKVRSATAKLFSERWIEDCAGTRNTAEDGEAEEIPPVNTQALLELLERIDVVNSGVEDGIALEALTEFWEARPDYRDAVNFEDPFWDNLTAESVFLARSLNHFCLMAEDGRFESLNEEKMPEVTKLAFFLQRYTNSLIQKTRKINELAEGEEEEDTVEQEFIVEQLLHIARTLDYSDEVGRRKMFSLLREILTIAELPEEITKLVVEVLRNVCGTDSAAEREFCGVVLEAVAEVHDTIAADDSNAQEEDESFHSAKSEVSETTPTKDKKPKQILPENEDDEEEKAIKEIMINMKCLHIAQCMLQNVAGNLQDNVHLETMVNNLVVPAVRSHEAPIRERGLLCLGLCCLLSKTLAEENLTLFLHCFNKGHDTLQTTAVHVLADIFTTHPSLLSATADPATQKSIFKVFAKGLRASQTPDVQSAAVTALCKLMLLAIITDEDLLRQLVILFFEPATKENAASRQALTYFLPVFCHSRSQNMELMAKCVPAVVHSLIGMGEELEEDEEMVGMTTVGGMVVDWTDPRKLIVQDEATVTWDEAGKREVKAVNGDIHLQLAEDLLERVMGHGCSKEEKKVLISILGKLYITVNSSLEKLQTVVELVVEATDLKVATDAASRNALAKLLVALTKAIGEAGKNSKSLASGLSKPVPEGEEDEKDPRAPVSNEEEILENDGADEEDATMMEVPEGEEADDETLMQAEVQVQDSVLDELLDEEEEL